MTSADFERARGFGPWNPGLESQIPDSLLHLATIFRPENAFASVDQAREFADLTGLPLAELAAFRPERLALHEVLVRVMADFSVPDGTKIEDLGIGFRAIVGVLMERHVRPRTELVAGTYDNVRQDVARRIDAALAALFVEDVPVPPGPRRSWLGALLRRDPDPPSEAAGGGWDAGVVAQWEARSRASSDDLERAAHRALARVVRAVQNRHGGPWGTRALLASVATGLACNEAASERIGAALAPALEEAARAEGFRLLPRQARPVVMNTKGPSASGKSTLRPLQKELAGRIGVDWAEFALISPDIWRKQLLDYASLGGAYKYAGAFTGDEVALIDRKLDRYMARKAERGGTTHLLIDRFRFDSFAPESDEAGSNLLTRFGQVVYLFFMITPPAALVERAWARGLEFGRYKSVDDVLAHAIEAYAGMPGLFFTWANRADKRVHFEFLDNGVAQGERPRTIAFGWNDALHVLDVRGVLDIERFRKVNVDAKSPSALYPDPSVLDPARNAAFLVECVRRFREVNFADRATGRIYARVEAGRVAWVEPDPLAAAASDPDTRAGLAAAVPGVFAHDAPTPAQPAFLAERIAADRIRTLGRWGRG